MSLFFFLLTALLALKLKKLMPNSPWWSSLCRLPFFLFEFNFYTKRCMLLKSQNWLILEASNTIVYSEVPLSPITTTPRWHTAACGIHYQASDTVLAFCRNHSFHSTICGFLWNAAIGRWVCTQMKWYWISIMHVPWQPHSSP